MNMVVCVKQVPDTTEVRIDPKTNTLMREGVPSIVNPYDAHAVEAALQLKDKFGGKVTAISMGPPQASAALKKVIGQGADRAILLSDRAFAGADTLATSYVLAQAIRKIRQTERIDLVLCGKQAIDGDTAQVGPGIATRLGLPLITYVVRIGDVDPDGGWAVFERLLEEGREVVRTQLPAVITVVKEINEERYSSLTHMIRAARYEVEVWDKDAIEADVNQLGLKGSPTSVSKIFAPPQREGGEIISGGDEDPVRVSGELVSKLLENDVVKTIASLSR